MKNGCKKRIAFTLAETMVVFLIIGIIAIAMSKISQAQLNFARKSGYYASLTNLKRLVGETIAAGTVDTSAQDAYQIALAKYNTDLAAYNNAWAAYNMAKASYDAEWAAYNSAKAAYDSKVAACAAALNASNNAYDYWNSIPATTTETHTETNFVSYQQSDYDTMIAVLNRWNNGTCGGNLTFCNQIFGVSPYYTSDGVAHYDWTNQHVVWDHNYRPFATYDPQGPYGMWITFEGFLGYMDTVWAEYQYWYDRWSNGYYIEQEVTNTIDNTVAKNNAWNNYQSLHNTYLDLFNNLGTEPNAPTTTAPTKPTLEEPVAPVDPGPATGTPEPILPSTGLSLCNRFTTTLNTVGAISCANVATSTFDDTNVNFTSSNGVKYYNMGANPTNLSSNDLTEQVYTIYIDIDGNRGKSNLNEDVMAFTMDRAGLVLPLANSKGANDTNYLSTSIKYTNSSGTVSWLSRNVPYRQAICQSGEYTNSNYCGAQSTYTTAYSKRSECNVANAKCEVVINKP